MLKALQFVRGAVNKYKQDMSMHHFVIRDGRVTGYGSVLALSSPIPISLDCQPDAQKLVKAVGTAKAAVELSMTKGGQLRFKSGATKAIMIPVYPDPIAEVWPEGEMVPVRGPALLDAMKKLMPFVCTNEETPNQWSRGILFNGKSAFATNNYVLTECWVDSMFSVPANVPLDTVRELLRINEPPTHVAIGNGNMTFYFEGDRWLRTQLYSSSWPSVVRDLLPTKADGLKALPHDFWDAVETVREFKDDRKRVYLDGDTIRSALSEDEPGSAHVVCNDCGRGLYNVDHLFMLKDHVVAANFNGRPGKFMGDKIRGVINPMTR